MTLKSNVAGVWVKRSLVERHLEKGKGEVREWKPSGFAALASRARSSVVERASYKRVVAGSIPAEPTEIKNPPEEIRGIFQNL